VVVAILGIILGGIYGLFDAANKSYLNTRALVESQETARVVMNYLLFRLREIDGSGMVKDPTDCRGCHQRNLDGNPADSPYIPCPQDVSLPRRNLYIEFDKTAHVTMPALDGVSSVYQNLSGYNKITFWADLLPTTNFSEDFTDSPRGDTYRNGRWDLIPEADVDKDGKFDPDDDYEYLNDLNDDGNYDYYGERWSFRLKTSTGKNYFLLVESLSFTDDYGNDFSDKNKSSYGPYTDQPVAYGVTGLGIKVIPKFYPDEFQALGGDRLKEATCGNSSDRDTCHGKKASDDWRSIYDNETAFSYKRFVETHPFWNIEGLSLEVATVDPQGQKFMKMKQMLIPRNFEANQDVNLQ
jgi:hypothetical protein